jgi:curved DNA-binding protein CbpA
MKDLYTILEVSRTAGPEVIRAAYRTLAKKYHPDNKETGNPTMFRAAKEAHDTLLDPAQRQMYDAQTQQNEHQNGHAQQAPPQPRRVWVNGLGWVVKEDDGVYPGDIPQYPQPQPNPFTYPSNGMGFEEMMREAAGGVAHSLVDQIVEELIFKMTRGRR